MRVLRLLSAGALALVFSSCASMQRQGPPPVLAKLQQAGVDSRTYAKIVNHRVLSYDDIMGMLKKGVPSPVIQTYLQSTHAPYTFTYAQLQALSNAGASADLVNYLGKSVGFFEATERSQTGGAGKWKDNPFFNDPYYMGMAPFGYAWPDEWYDAGWMDGVY
jgi:hypothetical protein